MNGNLKNIATGTGVIFGLNLLLGILIGIYVAQISLSETEPLAAGLAFGTPLFIAISLGIFFVGGLTVGFMEDRVNLAEPILAALLAMGLVTVAVSFGMPETIFLNAFARSGAWGSLVTTLASGVIATTAGALIGERMRTPAGDDGLARGALTVGLALVIVGPFMLLTRYGMPWSVVLIVVLILLSLLGLAYYRFTKGSPIEEEISDISISPSRRPPR
ncbi:MAG: hypothetical protein HY650_04165 [Acidobacteria bacterium]|nr:hypothetical protein [Acidobacteriota bacterium]